MLPLLAAEQPEGQGTAQPKSYFGPWEGPMTGGQAARGKGATCTPRRAPRAAGRNCEVGRWTEDLDSSPHWTQLSSSDYSRAKMQADLILRPLNFQERYHKVISSCFVILALENMTN